MEPDIKHIFADGLYAKEAHIPAGMQVTKHTHEFTHFSILAKGRVMVRAGDSLEVYEAPACITIEAGILHEVLAITDVTWYCVHATDETDESLIDEVLITKRVM